MFTYKTDAQLQEMSASERDAYAEAKRKYELDITNDTIKKATDELKSGLSEAQKKEVEDQFNATKEEMDSIKEDLRVIKESTTGVMNRSDWDSIMNSIEKELPTFLSKVKEAKKNAGAENPFEIEMTVKAAVNITTGAITNNSATPVGYVYQQVTAYSEDVRGSEYILNYIDNGSTDRVSLPYMDKVPTEGAMAITSEGALKPLISVSFVLRYSTAKKLAGRTKISEEALDDIPFIMSTIKGELKYQHDIAVQSDVFTFVSGIAPAFVAGSLADTTDSPTNYDAIRAAIYQVKMSSKGLYIPNVVLVPAADAYTMGATKDTTHQYVLPPFVLPDGTKVSGVKVLEVVDGTVADGSFIVGDFKKVHRPVYKGFTVRIGQGIVGSATAANIVSDFESNMYSLVGESRYHTWIYENEKTAFVKSTFAAVKTAIDSAT